MNLDQLLIEGKWKLDGLSNSFDPNTSQILKNNPFNKDREDTIVWARERMVISQPNLQLHYYSTALLATILIFTRRQSLSWVWKLHCHHKLKPFIWLLINHALPTRKFLTERNIIHDTLCPLCHTNCEISLHNFKECQDISLLYMENVKLCH